MDLPEISQLDGLKDVFSSFLKKRERVLLCFPGSFEPLGRTVAGAVEQAGGVPVFWGSDLRWKTLLRKGFQERCGTVVGPPGIILGLSKLARRAGAPLYIRNAVLLGDQEDPWLRRSISDVLDCQIRSWIPGNVPPAPMDDRVEDLLRELRRWTTILEVKLDDFGPGLSLELVTFPGEKLPRLPSFGRLVVRDWDSERDVPLEVPLRWRTGDLFRDDH